MQYRRLCVIRALKRRKGGRPHLSRVLEIMNRLNKRLGHRHRKRTRAKLARAECDKNITGVAESALRRIDEPRARPEGEVQSVMGDLYESILTLLSTFNKLSAVLSLVRYIVRRLW